MEEVHSLQSNKRKLVKLIERIKIAVSPHKNFIHRDLKLFVRHLESVCKNSKLVIADIGSGKSPYKKYLQHLCQMYLTTDISESYRPYIVADAQYLPLKFESVDLILLTEVLEHLQTPKKALLEINRVLKPKGFLILTVPFVIRYHDSIDFFRFTDTALIQLLSESGFSIVYLKKRGGIFATMGSILFHIPDITEHRIIRYILYLILAPFILLCFIIDSFDKKKDYTLGFDILVIKEREVGYGY